MNLFVLELADKEVKREVSYYNKKLDGLGERFALAVNDCFEIIKIWPFAYREIRNGYRMCGVKVFPHAVIYKVYNGDVYVIAVAPYKKRPYYWRRRKLPK